MKKAQFHHDEPMSVPKPVLTDYVGSLAEARRSHLNQALAIALQLV